MNSENSKSSDPYKFALNIADKIDLQRSNKYIASSNLSTSNKWKKIKNSHKNNAFNISLPTWSEKSTVPDGSYSVSDIEDCFMYVNKRHKNFANSTPIKIYIHKIENKIIFENKN